MAAKIKIVYCTASSYKREEWERFSSEEIDGRVVADLFSMEFRAVETDEPLLRDIAEMMP